MRTTMKTGMKAAAIAVLALLAGCLLTILLMAPFAHGAALQIDFLLSQVRNATGSLAGGKVYFYSAGTSTPKDVYLDINKTPPAAANPYTLDSNGTAQLYGDGNYRIVIKTSAGVTVYDRDNITIEGNATALTGETYLSVMDHGAVGDGTTDDTSAIQDAINHAASGNLYSTARGGSVFFPKGDYKVTSALTLEPGVHLIGDSADGVRILSYLTSGHVIQFDADSWDATIPAKNILENFSIVAKTDNNAGDGLHLNGTANVNTASAVVRNVAVICDRGSAYNLRDGVSAANTEHLIIDNVRVQEATRYGVHLNGTNTSATVMSSHTQECGSDGFRITAVRALIASNESYNDEGHGFYFDHLEAAHVVNNDASLSHLENMELYHVRDLTLSSNYILSDHEDGLSIDGGMGVGLRYNMIKASGSPTGYAIVVANSPTSLRIEPGNMDAFASGTYSSETYPDALWGNTSGENYLKGVLDVADRVAIGDGTRTGEGDLEVEGSAGTAVVISREATGSVARLRYLTQPTTGHWDIQVPPTSANLVIHDEVNDEDRVLVVPGTHTSAHSAGMIVVDGDNGLVSLAGHLVVDDANDEIAINRLLSMQAQLSLQGKVSVDQATAPTLSSCGTSPTITTGSSDHAGTFTIGATGTGCVVTFNTAYTAAPACVLQSEDVSGLDNYHMHTTSIDVVALPGVYHYICYELNE